MSQPQLIEEDSEIADEPVIKQLQSSIDSDLMEKIKDLIQTHSVSKIDAAFNEFRLTDSDKIEPILNPDNQQFTVLPIKYNEIWEHHKVQEAAKWVSGEIDFSDDYSDYKTLEDDVQHFIKMTLAFFASSDGIVNFNLTERFTREFKINEILIAYQFQVAMENVHSETYSLMLDNIIKDTTEKDHLFNAIKTVPAVKIMADYAFKWIESRKSIAHRVVAFAIIEGIFFSGAFASIFWLKKYKGQGRDFMNGLIKSNKLIARDEGLHCKFACLIYNLLENKLSQDDIFDMMKEGVDIAKNFSTESIPVRLIGMNNKMMCDYLEYIGDRLLNMLGYKKLYNTTNSFKFMDTIGLTDVTNFFESRPTEYQDPHILNKSNNSKLVINNTIEDINALDF